MKKAIKKWVPETPNDIQQNINIFVNFKESEVFQLIFVEVDGNGICKNQIFARFKAKRIKGKGYLLKKMDFKLINMNINQTEDFDYIKSVSVERVGMSLIFTMDVATSHEIIEGVHFTLKSNIIINKRQSFQFLMDTFADRNGRPCRVTGGGG